MMAALAGLHAAGIVEAVVDQADGLQVGIRVGESDPVVRFIQPDDRILEMAGLAVNSQVRSMSCALPVNRVAVAALTSDGRAMRRSRHIGMALDTGNIPMRVVAERLGGNLQGYLCFANGSAAVGAGVTIAAKRFG